jgi:TolB protein
MLRAPPACGTPLRARTALPACVAVLAVVALTFSAVVSAQPSSGRVALGERCPEDARPRTELVNVSTEGVPADARVLRATVSGNGRFVAFSSAATNLVPDDTNAAADVFVRDLRTRTTTRISVTTAGVQGDAASYFPSISADGRVVAFRSLARNLVDDDRNNVEDVFVHDRVNGLTERVSVGGAGQEGNAASITSSISADGTVIAFSSSASNLVRGDRNNVMDVFVRDMLNRRTIRVSVGEDGEANLTSEGSGISGDGSSVVFRSFASNLVGGDTNGLADVFVRDWVAGITERVNVSSKGAQSNNVTFRGSISGDGSRVAFRSRATNLVKGDTNAALDVFEHDRISGVTRRISVATAGVQADGSMFPRPERAGTFMSRAFLSTTGRFAAFGSRAPNLVDRDTNWAADVFVHDLMGRRTVRVSVSASGVQANDDSFVVGISGDASVVVFVSSASNLVPGDTNGRRDAFVRLRAFAPPGEACIAARGAAGP